MLRRILVPVDGSRFAEDALPIAFRLARRDYAQVDLVMVYEPPLPIVYAGGAPVREPAYDRERRRDAITYLGALMDRLEPGDRARAETVLLDGRIVDSIRDYAEAREVDLVVMTTHARGGASRAWLGSVADGLVRRSPAPVLLARGEAQKFANVLLPLDGSPEGEAIVDRAVEVAGTDGVKYTLLRVLASGDPPGGAVLPRRGEAPSSRTQKATVEAGLEARAEALSARGLTVRFHTVINDNPAQGILQYAAESGADLVAMTTRSRGGVERLLLGSVADKVLRGSDRPMLVLNPTVVGERATAFAGASGRQTSN